ncbi:hypothetical protein E2562_013124 [Oryza meyeriana var. granulata]|uniref:TFIIS N-terminal domain-containing protein n=1 Tax=Oryza meyeriana var. granulata TaxID=110450 RepID=A0A6G1F7V0_9ORYZ|nr:hypothetical protein E2562_013124 [Oryza meyeriana var. granulata]
MAAQGPLRRWKRFLPAFSSVDAAIEAAEPGLSRVEFREARLKILEMLCDCDSAADDAVAERLCVVLDEVMVESLLTLEMVPTMPKTLASTDLAKDVGALRNHESGRVRGLATGIVRRWRASVKADLSKAVAAMEKLAEVLEPDEADHQAKILEPSAPKKTAPNALKLSFPKKQSASAAKTAKIIEPPREKLPAAAVGSFRTSCRTDERGGHEDATIAAKRKLREGYREAEDAKRQRTVRVIEAPDMAKQRRKRHPIIQQRNRSSCASSTATARRASSSSCRRV